MGMLVFFNGQFLPEAQAVVSVNDRGFLLGDGLFETMRVVRGKPFRFAQHLERLARGADFLKIKCSVHADRNWKNSPGSSSSKIKCPKPSCA